MEGACRPHLLVTYILLPHKENHYFVYFFVIALSFFLFKNIFSIYIYAVLITVIQLCLFKENHIVCVIFWLVSVNTMFKNNLNFCIHSFSLLYSVKYTQYSHHSHNPMSSPTISIFILLNCSQPNICVIVSHYALNLHFSDYSWTQISFICLLPLNILLCDLPSTVIFLLGSQVTFPPYWIVVLIHILDINLCLSCMLKIYFHTL